MNSFITTLIISLLLINCTVLAIKTTNSPKISTTSSSSDQAPSLLWGVFNEYNYVFHLQSWEIGTKDITAYALPADLGDTFAILSADSKFAVVVNCDDVNLNVTQVDLLAGGLATTTLYSIPWNSSEFSYITSFAFNEETECLYATASILYTSAFIEWDFSSQKVSLTNFTGSTVATGTYDPETGLYYAFIQDGSTVSIMVYVYNTQTRTPVNSGYPLNYNYGFIQYIIFAGGQLFGIEEGGKSTITISTIDLDSGSLTFYCDVYSFIDETYSGVSYGSYIIFATTEGSMSVLNTAGSPQIKTYQNTMEFPYQGDFQIATA